ncbi:MAG: AmmeMemoRadiSam system protein B [Candidatus Omnitrophica bacterium]|nr:AmmeMemoRadiSam system protein B [Candidatus Omnitrophota bacterium]
MKTKKISKNLWKIFFSGYLLFAIGYLLFATHCFSQDIKSPNVAGSFYPDEPGELSKIIDNFLDAANPESVKGDIIALISPHAGYGYSAATAAYGYKLIKDKPYKTVVVIGSSHYYRFSGVSVYPEGIFRTPLGDLEIDNEFTQGLLDKDIEIFFDPDAFQKEHSIEVQLPFLQKVLSNFKIVPIVMGDCSFATCQRLAGFLREIIGSRSDVLIVASSDLYHGYDYEEAETVDGLTLSYLNQMNPKLLDQKLREGSVQLCGGIPVVTTMLLARELGYDKPKVLKYTNSAIVTGKRIKGIWTVGYASCVVSKEEESMLNEKQKKRLLEIARGSIEHYLKTGKKLEVSEADPGLCKEMGAFVTLHKQGQLRGCIGHLIGNKPLYLTVRDMAIESAVGDPRFTPVEENELKDIDIEISVLSPLQRIDSSDKIQLGMHGVLVRQGLRSGVFLPQVAIETGWSKEEFLSNLCAHKAGISPDAWKDTSTEIYIFTAELFSEKDYQ